jgi:hypothetical protein
VGAGWTVGAGFAVGRAAGALADGLGVSLGLARRGGLGLAGPDELATAGATADALAGESDPTALPSRWLLVQPAASRPMITLTASTAVRHAGVSCGRAATDRRLTGGLRSGEQSATQSMA